MLGSRPRTLFSTNIVAMCSVRSFRKRCVFEGVRLSRSLIIERACIRDKAVTRWRGGLENGRWATRFLGFAAFRNGRTFEGVN